ncbi:MAG: PBP1A family penicillin-binding protein [Spirochaetia bacterium]|nr:PBP1A family penicillin-binding protein [Spirochaetia bacterium]
MVSTEHAGKRPSAFLVVVYASLGILLLAGIGAGVAIAATVNTINIENFTELDPALPSRILDSKGRLITEFYSEEKRELIAIKDLPRHLVDALITREDDRFWTHRGFTVKSIVRAVVGRLIGRNLGGGSTITQQLAGTLYADRSDISLKRKLVELWWAFQLERRYSKEEILELYLNRMAMGPGVYGFEAASKFYFGHSAREATLAESAILVVTLSSPYSYNPIDFPNRSRDRSRAVLSAMVEAGYATEAEAQASFDDYWDNFDYTRASTSAFFSRSDEAPWFSEYVHRALGDLLYGSIDLYKDGLTVHTTLDLDFQKAADRYMKRGIELANREFLASSSLRLREADSFYVPLVELVGLSFGFSEWFAGETEIRSRALDYYNHRVNPVIDAAAMLFGLAELKRATDVSYAELNKEVEKGTVEGALVTLELDTGHIKALVGGSKYTQASQYIRATQAKLMPGSSFKPFLYSAAIDARKSTMATLIYDEPVVFYNADGTEYIPRNYSGTYYGPILLWKALSLSLNIPAVRTLDAVGFDPVIDRAGALLGITDPAEKRQTFPRYYPLALGVIGVTPLQMTRAYSVFGNQGRAVDPIAITYVEDRSGKIILEPEKDLRADQKRRGDAIQVVSPQNAAIMTDLLSMVTAYGTLRGATDKGQYLTYRNPDGSEYTIPLAGKTGTTQNWEDAWVIGYSPYLATATWFGFDRRGNSLGVAQTGETIARYVWADYMKEIHEGLPPRAFAKPQTGLVSATVCAVSGLLPTEACTDGQITLSFLAGTQPDRFCDVHGASGGFNSPPIDPTLFPSGIDIDTTIDLGLDLEALLGGLGSGLPSTGSEGESAPAPSPQAALPVVSPNPDEDDGDAAPAEEAIPPEEGGTPNADEAASSP